MKKSIFAVMAAAALLASAPLVRAQETKKVAVVSVASFDEWIADLGFLGKLAGKPDAASQAEGLIKLFANDLKGMDKSKPLGAVVSMSESKDEPLVLAFVPVTDLKDLLGSLAGAAKQEAKDEGDGVFSMDGGPDEKIFIKQIGGWAFVTQSVDQLADAPGDPLKLLDGLDSKYDLAARVYVQNIPAKLRQEAIDGLKEGAESSLGDPSDEDYEVRKKLVENQVKQFEMVINEAEEVTFGWNADETTKRTYMDFSMKVVPGGTLAKQIALMKDLKSEFAGFLLPDGAVGTNASVVYSETDADELASQVAVLKARALEELDKDASLGEDKKPVVKEVVGELMDALVETIKDRRVDFGASLLLRPKALTFVAGVHVADGEKVTASIKKLAKLAEEDKDFPGIKWNADKHEGVSFHTITVDVPEDDARKVLGEKVDVVIGESKNAIYLGFGADCLATLKSTIDGSLAKADDSAKPGQFVIAVAPIVQFVASIEDNPMLRIAAEEAAKLTGNDRILMTINMIENGQSLRLEVESGVIELIGKVSGAAVGGR